VDDLKPEQPETEKDGEALINAADAGEKRKFMRTMSDEVRKLYDLLKTLDIWLLMPIAMYLGFELTLIWYEYSRVRTT
jgi:hypothetical protein